MRKRFAYFKEAIGRPIARWISFGFFIVGVWDTLAAQFLPPEWEEEWPTAYSIISAMSGYIPWWGWVIGALTVMLLLSNEYGYGQQPRPSSNGPAYWTLSEAVSWIAFGIPITKERWATDFLSKKSNTFPEDESRLFDKAEKELFDKLAAKTIKAFGKRVGVGSHIEIPYTYFLSDVSCFVFNDEIGMGRNDIGTFLKWDGPKWEEVRLERDSIQKKWPIPLKDREEGLAICGKHADKNYRTVDLHEAQRAYICEIEVRNLSKTMRVSGVTIEILQFDGAEVMDLPQTLLPKDQSINAGTSKTWKVAQGSHYELGEEVDLYLNIEYRGRPYRIIGNQPYKIEFRASGQGVEPTMASFMLDFDESKRPILMPLDR